MATESTTAPRCWKTERTRTFPRQARYPLCLGRREFLPEAAIESLEIHGNAANLDRIDLETLVATNGRDEVKTQKFSSVRVAVVGRR